MDFLSNSLHIMLKIIKKENHYEVIVESNNKVIGNFVQEVDGYYYFLPKNQTEGSLWSDYMMLEIVNNLRELNKPWDDEINEWNNTLMDGLDGQDYFGEF